MGTRWNQRGKKKKTAGSEKDIKGGSLDNIRAARDSIGESKRRKGNRSLMVTARATKRDKRKGKKTVVLQTGSGHIILNLAVAEMWGGEVDAIKRIRIVEKIGD